ncbi:dihydrofolate reductase [Subtercola boreus]|nr:dihydrofolate reductase [Subtercola boreus]TQL52690.1 dihydrofolate reductase [Subtercola boreus]
MSLALIWAEARGGIIGYDGAMPWHLPEDLAHFRELTSGDAGAHAGTADRGAAGRGASGRGAADRGAAGRGASDRGATVVMGRRTWESLPERFRPLPGRRNLVLTRNAAWAAEGAERVATLDAAVAAAGAAGGGAASGGAARGGSARGGSAGRTEAGDGATLWVIGGGELYRLAAASQLATRLEVTELDLGIKGDTFAPAIDASWLRAASTPWLESRTGIRYRFVSYAR